MATKINGTNITADTIQQANRSLRSREMNEVISVKPGFIINWGMYIMLLIFCIIIFLIIFIKFPQTVSMSLNIHTISATPKQEKYLAIGKIHLKNSKDIQPGQKAFLQLYGEKNTDKTIGIVTSVTLIPADSVYQITIASIGTIVSDYELPAFTGKPGTVTADILVGQQSLFDKLFTNRFSASKNN